MKNTITKYDKFLAELEENIRFYIKDESTFAEALIFSKKLDQFSEMIKEKVKKRGHEIMSDKNLKQFDFGTWRILEVDPTMIDEYSIRSLFNAVDNETAFALSKVDTAKLKMWLKKNRIEGELLMKISEGKKVKPKKGYIKLIEITPKEDESF